MQIGDAVGRYTIVGLSERDRWGAKYWLCKCECGVQKPVKENHLKNGKVKSCGCYKNTIATTHGYTRPTKGKRIPEYSVWAAMLARCNNPNNKKYPIYGGRGISVCERWKRFENFIADMGMRPDAGYSLDRYPNKDGDYEPGNCRWATIQEQNTNTNHNVWLTVNGVAKIAKDWCRELGIAEKTLRTKLRTGYTFEQIYNQAINKKQILANGVY